MSTFNGVDSVCVYVYFDMISGALLVETGIGNGLLRVGKKF